MIVLNMPQRSEEWYKARDGVMTASMCEDFMTPARRKSFINKMIAEYLTPEREPFIDNIYMQWGRDNEDAAREAYEQKTGNKVEQVGFVLKDEQKRVGCSPDGLIGKGGLVEIKCPMSKTHIGYMQEGPPKKYILQMQFQMYVTNRVWCDFVSFDPRLPKDMQLHVVRIDRDPATINKIEASVKATIKEIDEFLDTYNIKWSK